MNKHGVLNLLGIGCLIFAIGVIVGERQRGKGTFFKSWYDDKSLYYGEKVKVKEGLETTHFYNANCKKMSVIGLQAVDNSNLAWVLLERCVWSKDYFTMETFNQNELEKK